MTTRSIALCALLTSLPTAAALAAGAPSRVAAGDATRGAALFGLHCASCHGADARGGGALAAHVTSPAPTDLRDFAFLMQRSDDDLQQAVAAGGKARGRSWAMPAFGAQLAPLDVWDLVAFVREGQPSVGEYFPAAARFTAKTYAFDADGARRLEAALGKLAPDEGKMVLVTAYGGDKVEGDEPVYVPDDPRMLAALKPKQKLGYLGFGRVKLPGGLPEVTLCLALDKDGAVSKVSPRLDGLAEKDREAAAKLLAGYEGQGGKKSPYQELKAPSLAAPAKGKKPAPKKDKDAPKDKDAAEAAKALTRPYLRVVEAAVQFDKEERERHWAD